MTKNSGREPSKSPRLRVPIVFFLTFFFISEACDSDDGDPDVEFEAWKFRELQRLKRDREAREAEEAEQVLTWNIKWSACSRWSSSLYCPIRNLGQMTIRKTHPTLVITVE